MGGWRGRREIGDGVGAMPTFLFKKTRSGGARCSCCSRLYLGSMCLSLRLCARHPPSDRVVACMALVSCGGAARVHDVTSSHTASSGRSRCTRPPGFETFHCIACLPLCASRICSTPLLPAIARDKMVV